jgi:hypothetical protein
MDNITPEPLDTLRLEGTAKKDDIVHFIVDTTRDSKPFLQRYSWTSSQSREDRLVLLGRVVAIRRMGEGFFYRIESGSMGFDVSYKDIVKVGE